jgi:hypothetical protein
MFSAKQRSAMRRHRHQQFIHFLNTIEARVPAGKVAAVGSHLDLRISNFVPKKEMRAEIEAPLKHFEIGAGDDIFVEL